MTPVHADVRAFVSSSPGKLLAMGMLLVLVCLTAGLTTSEVAAERQDALRTLLADAEPDAYSAHSLYTALSVADAAAGTAFIAGGLEPQPVRDRYSQAVGEAAAELVARSGHSAEPVDGPDTTLRTEIATGLPVYTGLVETARTANRSGYPVGAAYLSEASNQMQNVLLPMAGDLHEHRSAAVVQAQRDHVRPPWKAILLLVGALLVLLWAQREIAHRWRRTLNPGLLAASVLLLGLFAWTVVAGSISAAAMVHGRDQGAVPGSRLTESRILVQQARAAETVKLVRRDATGDYDRSYEAGITRLAELLDGYPPDAPAAGDIAAARTALARWQAAHQRMNDTLNRGDWVGAAVVATGPGQDDSAAQVQALDTALEQAVTETRDRLRGEAGTALRALNLLAPGAYLLGVLAAVCVVLGLWPRLREYR
ncbi:hypothetical protein [Nocardia sp. NPDC057353]|uniref:hypothetical protein n=1 Tax=Nocardia sp. NPDC057353 TaxID=3346104 RepID=UPI00362A9FEB